jgi:hypothetical protein
MESTGGSDPSVRRQLSRALIKQAHVSSGGIGGPIGLPMGDLRLTSDGAVGPYSGGFIVLNDIKADPIVTFKAEVRFLGFRCHEESNEASASDEPYFIISVLGTNSEGQVTRLFGPYENVDAGENHFEPEASGILTSEAQPPFLITVTAMENDEGNPEDALNKAKKTIQDSINITQAVGVLLLQPAVVAATVVLNTFFQVAGGLVGSIATSLFGLEDDLIGTANARVLDWNDGLEDWETPGRIIEPAPFSNSPYNLKLDLGQSSEGKYTLYFNINVFKVNTQHVPAKPPA